MTSDQVREAYLAFFVKAPRNHQLIPPAPLVPLDDPTTLFTNSGMQQLVPYLKGATHPMGKRLVDSQPCFRAEDIEEIGDTSHTTFFEMLGNWSLGDYFKKEQLTWFWQFLTETLKLSKERLYVTVFAGDNEVDKDKESIAVWEKLGIAKDHIFEYGPEKNWWSRAGTPKQMPAGEIGGTTSEVFFLFDKINHDPAFGSKCHPNCQCGRFLEIGNSVFMEYEKQKDGTLKSLPKQNVDFGGGLERLTAAANNQPDVFLTDVFADSIKTISQAAGVDYQTHAVPIRVIADHLRAAKAMLKAGINPGNKQQGYVLRRLIRRSGVKMRQLSGELKPEMFAGIVPDQPLLVEEMTKFSRTIERGIKELKKIFSRAIGGVDPENLPAGMIFKNNRIRVDGNKVFKIYETYGLDPEIAQEIMTEWGLAFDEETMRECNQAMKAHQQKSRTASAGMFKGGLADHSDRVVKLHTATHLLHAALRQVLGESVRQEGSNITSERLRFDFKYDKPLTDEQKQKVEKLVNDQIKADLPVVKTIEDKKTALASGAMAFFKETYPDKVSVYTIGDFSKELCGGPHVSSTGEIGGVKIIKDQSIGAGKRRLYAVLNDGNKKPA